MTGVLADSLAAEQDFGLGPAPRSARLNFLGMHHLRTLAAALTVGVCLLYRSRFQRIGCHPEAAALMRNRGQSFSP